MPADKKRRVELTAASRAAGREIDRPGDPADPARRDACRLDLLRFATEYFPLRFPLRFSADHLAMIDRLQATVLGGGQYAVAMPRGSGKTTLSEVACLWALLYGHRRFVFVVAATGTHALELTDSLRIELANNGALLADFPEACGPIVALGGISRRAEGQAFRGGGLTHLVWNKDKVRLPCTAAGGGSVIRSAGIDGSIRGAKASLASGENVRPDLILLDDPQTNKSAKSATQTQARMETIQGTILNLSGPGSPLSVFAAVTVIKRGDLADQLLDRKAHPEWQGHRFRMVNAMPKRVDLWDRYAAILRDDLADDLGNARALEFYEKNRHDMDEGSDVSWPDRMLPTDVSALQHAMDLRITKGEAAFAAEYQNSPLDGSSDPGSAPQITAKALSARLNHIPQGMTPSESTILTAAVDVQKSSLWWVITAWTDDFSGDVIAYGCHPDPRRPYFTMREIERTLEVEHPGGSWEASLYAGLETVCAMILDTDWKRDDGTSSRVEQVLIDAAYGKSSDTIYSFAYRSRFSGGRVLPYFGREIKPGAKQMDEWKKNKGDRQGVGWKIPKPVKRQTRHCLGDANYWKSFVADRLLSPPGSSAGLSLFGDSMSNHRLLADHLTAEKRTRVLANGRTSDLWIPVPNRDNHWLDALAMSACAAAIRGAKLDVTSATVAEPAQTADPCPPPVPQLSPPRQSPPPVIRPALPGGGWLSGYGRMF